jgi:hypothetical protein
MAPETLAALPQGSIVFLDGEEGEVIRAGQLVYICWPTSGVTQIIYTDSEVWREFISWLEVADADTL